LFLVVSDAFGECFDGGAEVSDFSSEAGEGPGFMAAKAVLVDHGSEGSIPVEAGPADAGVGGDAGEGDGKAVAEELGAGPFDVGEGVG